MNTPVEQKQRAEKLSSADSTLKERIISIGAVVLSFLASQHHIIHMLILLFGVGGAGMSFMQSFPWIRRGMLTVALIATAFTLSRLLTKKQSRSIRILGIVSILLTIGMLIWSISQFGL